ncbi:NrfD/PsrC family molybdoenzyme membrane anchor subunit [Muricoccus pecuniae]|uniref:Molybdopterin-containing oxidoreductase family membrane subunit n=1 Tax=Muricoccus pecuniae TaxID=693023 RepID=A0A840Y4K8_9PROT|nr:NrfD/PsrC family molybdoenzyme membrane anchor subunit [Roseomonas pecuniae]MBB5695096.1 molybdopterin-containing oxidoreductase family membrane subunit [Roseomonas pecuniae]
MSDVTAPVAEAALRPGRWSFRLAVLLCAAGIVALAVSVAAVLVRGVGVWGNNIPHVWGFDLIAYAWWIGIANAASLFAAILVLRRHGLRTAVNRFAEAAALAAILAAALYPILHLGRPWLFLWTLPYPSYTGLWPQFGSPLVWDFWGIMSHVIVTSLFWYIGLIPDLATMRDRAAAAGRTGLARGYGLAALGWRGSVAHWHRHQAAYRLVAAMVLPLLLWAQTVVALEFATTVVPAWHQARLPLHVVVTGLPSGLGVVLALAAVLRVALSLERFVDDADMDLLGQLVACAGLAAGLAYAHELLVGFLEEDPTTRAALAARVLGEGASAYWGAVLLSAVLPQILWSKGLRRRAAVVVPVGVLAAAGVWLDRWSIVVDGLLRDHLPDLSRGYSPSAAEWGLLGGTVSLFALTLLVFGRLVPAVSMFETRHEESEAEAEKEER